MSLIKIAITAVAIATILGCGVQAAAALGHPVGPAIVAAAAPLIQSDPTLAKTKEAIDAAAVRQAQVAAIDKTDIAAAAKDDRPPHGSTLTSCGAQVDAMSAQLVSVGGDPILCYVTG